ncbi:glycoside hydrolase [Clavulina sp. PMI_390]|nr:glycoside hydrolase [Clavulina sp. PMI_390]
MSTKNLSIDVFPSSSIAPVSPLIYSGFLEHLGRCIYGGVVPAGPTNFPYSPRNPCPPEKFIPTPEKLLVTKHQFRADVLSLVRDELQVPMMRWPGGNYVSSYRWEDGIGRVRRPELAWGGEESNQFGTDEFIAWCNEAKCEPYICLNMGTGSLQEAINWVEYCNGTGDTYYANLRRTNTGKDEPHGVKYWGLGNEIWGEWQVGQQTAEQYAHKCRQWAHALKLVDPNIIVISCGETGLTAWDDTVLSYNIDKIDLHSVHLYTGFGARDRSEKDKEYHRTVYGPEAAEQGIEIARGLIEKARVAKGVTKKVKLAFDEWNGWDEELATPQNGLQQFYNLTDALSVASWLNVFVRQSATVEIACLAQSVNVISPIITSPTGFFRQTTFYPLKLFSNYMRGPGAQAVSAIVANGPKFEGETLPTWIGTVRGPPQVLDISAVVVPAHGQSKRSLRLAVVNRSRDKNFDDVPIRIAFEMISANTAVEAHEVWNADVNARNGFDKDEHNVVTRSWTEPWAGHWSFKAHSFTLLVLDL